ncbi:transmembrane protein 143 isoform X2 [Python bivittatus]|uniref:Transmembrane protein 143 isoform X2 n=1 Tax=Python bivittatus TaxID=176946 RepID=A0A9F5MUP5_PYTBI|nr:transmembrane protein 143 isoform X2 [Python bivittatus]
MLSMTRFALGTRILGLSLRGKSSLAATMAKYRKMWKPTEPQNWALDYQEKYIPFSKNQLVDALVKEFHSSNREERLSFLQFVSQVDSSLVPHYYSVLEQLKTLYTPINPDRDTLQEFYLTDAERLTKEQDVLARMEPLLDQANFNKLSKEALAYALIVNHPHDEVQVTVNLDQYEYITFWALGQRIGPLRVMTATRAQRRGFFGTARIPADRHYFKRVIVAARTKNAHLVLKCFKDIPLEGLEQLLPSVKVRTSIFYRALLNTMLMVFGQRRNIHSLELVHMLYYRSTSNNSELLDALTLRAQEEHAKEVILAHSFLLRCHPQHQHPLPKETGVETDSKPVEHLREQVEAWLRLHSGLEINFCAERACKHLKELGIRGAAYPVIR